MGTRNWSDLWDLLVVLISREPIFVEILFWLGIAFLAVMVLEGLRSSFVPKRAIESPPKAATEFSEKPMTLAEAPMHIRPSARDKVPQGTLMNPQQQANQPRVFRSMPREMRVLGASKSSS